MDMHTLVLMPELLCFPRAHQARTHNGNLKLEP